MDLASALERRDRFFCGHTDQITVTILPDEMSGECARFHSLEEIAQFPGADSILIAGLRQKDFERFVADFAPQFKTMHFWKCPYIEDLSALAALKNIEYITCFWNQRATRLWDMSGNLSLLGLELECFSKPLVLEGICSAPKLRELWLDHGLALGKYSVKSLWPLSQSASLENLTFNIFVEDNDPLALLHIRNLKELFFPPNMFSTEEIAFLTAKLPHVECPTFAPFIDYGEDSEKSICITGKRKPWLHPVKDAARIEKYKVQFEALVEKYKNER